MDKKRILFVDDESNVLQGLKRMLFGMRNEWDMAFAQSGEEALDMIAKSPCDVIVSDMRMPGMNGAQLLSEVMNRQPQIVRIVLSGHSDDELILRSVGPAHQYLSKPCDAETLKQTIRRACATRDLLAVESLKKVVTKLTSLPSLPTIYMEIVDEISSPTGSINRVGEIISRDAAMTAKILQLVNSAFFGQSRRVSDPSFAVSLLGLDTIRALALSVHIFSHFAMAKLKQVRLAGLWDHNLRVGALARDIAKAEGQDKKVTDDAFMAGLLHDIGKLVFAGNLFDLYAQVVEEADRRKVCVSLVEKEIIGASHAEVGGYLLGLWGLPDTIVEAVLFHHAPEKHGGTGFSPLLAVHAADCIEESFLDKSEIVGAPPQMDYDYLKRNGFLDRAQAWKDIYRRMIDKEAERG